MSLPQNHEECAETRSCPAMTRSDASFRSSHPGVEEIETCHNRSSGPCQMTGPYSGSCEQPIPPARRDAGYILLLRGIY